MGQVKHKGLDIMNTSTSNIVIMEIKITMLEKKETVSFLHKFQYPKIRHAIQARKSFLRPPPRIRKNSVSYLNERI